MDWHDNSLNSARRVNEVLQAQAKRQDEMIAASQAECKRRENVDNAQLQTAEELRKLREQFEQSQREQARETEESRELAIKSYKVSVAAAVFGGASFVAAFITLALQLLK